MGITPDQAIRQGSKSFALASMFLPSGNRGRVRILYQWCRSCDDLIDEARDPDDLKKRLDLLFQMQPPDWVNPDHARELIEGFKMDAAGIQIRSFSDLDLYCFRVAGVVGLMMCPLLDADLERAQAAASALGKAMQLTNICRDVQADAGLGRVYLPSEFWQESPCQPPAPTAAELAVRPELAYPAVKWLLEVADVGYREGFKGLRFLPLRCAFAIAVAGLVYQKIGKCLLEEAKKNPGKAFRKRIVVPRSGKLASLWGALWLVLRSRLPVKT